MFSDTLLTTLLQQTVKKTLLNPLLPWLLQLHQHTLDTQPRTSGQATLSMGSDFNYNKYIKLIQIKVKIPTNLNTM